MPIKFQKLSNWPPDLFAWCALTLKTTGKYTYVLESPLNDPKECQDLGSMWQRTGKPSKAIRELHQKAVKQKDPETICKLLAIADEASKGFGFLESTEFHKRATRSLLTNQSLSDFPKKWGYAVFPKEHTPTMGLTVRALSHHLALVPYGEIEVKWHRIPPIEERQSWNILIAPWPQHVASKQFSGDVKSPLFRVAHDEKRNVVAWFKQVRVAALKKVSRIDGVVFPEAALSQKEFNTINSSCRKQNAFLVAGISSDKSRENKVGFGFPLQNASCSTRGLVEYQSKHHRWRLDQSQIEMYGLAHELSRSKNWWEDIAIENRALNFFALGSNITCCTLICEDLARQDPVSEIVRSIGPNLVIALLMDAAQLPQRWPGRYAAVLAEDPGSSVLSVTCIGMVDRARTPAGISKSRSIGLWKDASGRTEVLELPAGADAIVLNLFAERGEEKTPDGRTDTGTFIKFGGYTEIFND